MIHSVCNTCGTQLNAIEVRANEKVNQDNNTTELICIDCSLGRVKQRSNFLNKINKNLN